MPPVDELKTSWLFSSFQNILPNLQLTQRFAWGICWFNFGFAWWDMVSAPLLVSAFMFN
jgi:hypothetical protein